MSNLGKDCMADFSHNYFTDGGRSDALANLLKRNRTTLHQRSLTSSSANNRKPESCSIDPKPDLSTYRLVYNSKKSIPYSRDLEEDISDIEFVECRSKSDKPILVITLDSDDEKEEKAAVRERSPARKLSVNAKEMAVQCDEIPLEETVKRKKEKKKKKRPKVSGDKDGKENVLKTANKVENVPDSEKNDNTKSGEEPTSTKPTEESFPEIRSPEHGIVDSTSNLIDFAADKCFLSPKHQIYEIHSNGVSDESTLNVATSTNSFTDSTAISFSMASLEEKANKVLATASTSVSLMDKIDIVSSLAIELRNVVHQELQKSQKNMEEGKTKSDVSVSDSGNSGVASKNGKEMNVPVKSGSCFEYESSKPSVNASEYAHFAQVDSNESNENASKSSGGGRQGDFGEAPGFSSGENCFKMTEVQKSHYDRLNLIHNYSFSQAKLKRMQHRITSSGKNESKRSGAGCPVAGLPKQCRNPSIQETGHATAAGNVKESAKQSRESNVAEIAAKNARTSAQADTTIRDSSAQRSKALFDGFARAEENKARESVRLQKQPNIKDAIYSSEAIKCSNVLIERRIASEEKKKEQDSEKNTDHADIARRSYVVPSRNLDKLLNTTKKVNYENVAKSYKIVKSNLLKSTATSQGIASIKSNAGKQTKKVSSPIKTSEKVAKANGSDLAENRSKLKESNQSSDKNLDFRTLKLTQAVVKTRSEEESCKQNVPTIFIQSGCNSSSAKSVAAAASSSSSSSTPSSNVVVVRKSGEIASERKSVSRGSRTNQCVPIIFKRITDESTASAAGKSTVSRIENAAESRKGNFPSASPGSSQRCRKQKENPKSNAGNQISRRSDSTTSNKKQKLSSRSVIKTDINMKSTLKHINPNTIPQLAAELAAKTRKRKRAAEEKSNSGLDAEGAKMARLSSQVKPPAKSKGRKVEIKFIELKFEENVTSGNSGASAGETECTEKSSVDSKGSGGDAAKDAGVLPVTPPVREEKYSSSTSQESTRILVPETTPVMNGVESGCRREREDRISRSFPRDVVISPSILTKKVGVASHVGEIVHSSMCSRPSSSTSSSPLFDESFVSSAAVFPPIKEMLDARLTGNGSVSESESSVTVPYEEKVASSIPSGSIVSDAASNCGSSDFAEFSGLEKESIENCNLGVFGMQEGTNFEDENAEVRDESGFESRGTSSSVELEFNDVRSDSKDSAAVVPRDLIIGDTSEEDFREFVDPWEGPQEYIPDDMEYILRGLPDPQNLFSEDDIFAHFLGEPNPESGLTLDELGLADVADSKCLYDLRGECMFDDPIFDVAVNENYLKADGGSLFGNRQAFSDQSDLSIGDLKHAEMEEILPFYENLKMPTRIAASPELPGSNGDNQEKPDSVKGNRSFQKKTVASKSICKKKTALSSTSEGFCVQETSSSQVDNKEIRSDSVAYHTRSVSQKGIPIEYAASATITQRRKTRHN